MWCLSTLSNARGIQSSWLSLVPTPLHSYGMRHSETRQSSFFLKHASGPIVALYIRTRDSGPKVSGQKISNPNCSPRNTLDFRPVPRSIIHSSVTWVPLVPSDMRKAWSQPSTWSLVKSYWWVNHWNLSTTVRHKSWTNRGGVLRISAYLQSGSLDLSSFLSPEICQKWPQKIQNPEKSPTWLVCLRFLPSQTW